MRIISLVPSMTATICALGKRDSIVGTTTFCVEPSNLAKTVTLIGGTKNPNLELIEKLRPDLIIVNTEENRREDIIHLRKLALVHESFPKSPLEVPETIRSLGRCIDAEDVSNQMASDIEHELYLLQSTTKKASISGKFLYLIWKDPWMVVGPDTYINSMLELTGLRNSITQPGYPQLTMPEILAADPDHIFFSSEPWPFRRRCIHSFAQNWQEYSSTHNTIWSSGRQLYKIDGKSMSWHGVETKIGLANLRQWRIGKDVSQFIRPVFEEL